MIKHDIPLETFEPTGKVKARMENGELVLTTINMSNGTFIPFKPKLPFRVDVALKANSSIFTINIGKGFISFSEHINECGGGIHFRRADIITGKRETLKSDYDNIFPLNEYVHLSIIYHSNITWVEINGKHCYSTRKALYIDLLVNNKLSAEFKDGFDLKIWSGQRNVELTLKSFTVTEYGSNELSIPSKIANMPELTPSEWRLKSLPHELRDRVKTDEDLAKYMRGNIKLNKETDEHGDVSIVLYKGWVFSEVRYKLQKPKDGGLPEWVKSYAVEQDYTPDPVALNVIEVHKPSDYKIGAVISFGNYYWRILDIQNDTALIITEEIIEQRPYHDVYKNITWAGCALRKYLNGEFYDSFDTSDKARIITVTNKNPDNLWYGTNGGIDTQDRIFILSLEEAVCTYFGDSSANLYNRGEKQKYWFERNDENNSKRGAKFKGVQCNYWLRTPGSTNVKAVYCGVGGIGIQGNNVLKGNISEGKCNVGVRSALCLRIK